MHFSEQTITQLVNLPQQQEMMERYHIEDCVKEIMIEQFDTELFYISAKVDVLYYEVPCNMMVDHGRIEMHQCTCTYHTETTACAHIGAVLRKINTLSISQFPFHYTKNAFSSLRY